MASIPNQNSDIESLVIRATQPIDAATPLRLDTKGYNVYNNITGEKIGDLLVKIDIVGVPLYIDPKTSKFVDMD